MELHQGRPNDALIYFQGWRADIEEIFLKAVDYAVAYHLDTLDYFRSVSLEDLTPERFWSEYVWTVYASGFNAKVLSTKFEALMNAVGPWDWTQPNLWVSKRVMHIIAHPRKCEAVLRCRTYLISMGWDAFCSEYCLSPEDLKELPYIGRITCYHIARNLGVDCVKPDLHLVRLSTRYSFENPEAMCAYLAGLSDERIGVVDFILWAYCAAFGTRELR